LNIGGIANYTFIDEKGVSSSSDLGPGNCLIDQWVRLNSKKKYDENGRIAKSGKIKKIIINKALKNFKKKKLIKSSFDVKDFDISFVRGLSLEDGAATLTEYTSEILYEYLIDSEGGTWKSTLIAGGGRKNKFLIKSIEYKIKSFGIPVAECTMAIKDTIYNNEKSILLNFTVNTLNIFDRLY